ncbi:hypothetical protein PR048_032497 [Dryococelus australis]|uniref:Uncharacterized protein n=1 Tax=Dryococelus australis TaxID=614101 RepID=A0ABQ9G5C1_9NEOP|nr:hypothetical protein PR048_032497 [Dryococelus australis]
MPRRGIPDSQTRRYSPTISATKISSLYTIPRQFPFDKCCNAFGNSLDGQLSNVHNHDFLWLLAACLREKTCSYLTGPIAMKYSDTGRLRFAGRYLRHRRNCSLYRELELSRATKMASLTSGMLEFRSPISVRLADAGFSLPITNAPFQYLTRRAELVLNARTIVALIAYLPVSPKSGLIYKYLIFAYDAASQRGFSRISRLPRPCIPALPHSHLASSSPGVVYPRESGARRPCTVSHTFSYSPNFNDASAKEIVSGYKDTEGTSAPVSYCLERVRRLTGGSWIIGYVLCPDNPRFQIFDLLGNRWGNKKLIEDERKRTPQASTQSYEQLGVTMNRLQKYFQKLFSFLL